MMNTLEYIIDKQNDKKIIKYFLRRHLGISARALIKLKKEPLGITLNGAHANVTEILSCGDTISLFIDETLEKEYPTENIKLDIIFEDDNFLIVNKPFGMPVYPVGKHKNGSLLSAFAFQSNLVFRALYRLDVNTSGIVVIAKNKPVSYSAKLKKKYLAVCHGETPDSGVITAKIGLKDNSHVVRTTGYGQDAYTEFSTLAYADGYSLVELIIKTGRTHQIRVHMSSIGFPLAGDDMYGGSKDCISRHALHCGEVKLDCDAATINRIFTSKVPADMCLAFPKLFTN